MLQLCYSPAYNRFCQIAVIVAIVVVDVVVVTVDTNVAVATTAKCSKPSVMLVNGAASIHISNALVINVSPPALNVFVTKYTAAICADASTSAYAFISAIDRIASPLPTQRHQHYL